MHEFNLLQDECAPQAVLTSLQTMNHGTIGNRPGLVWIQPKCQY